MKIFKTLAKVLPYGKHVSDWFWKWVRLLVVLLAIIASFAVLGITLLTCLDIVLRTLGYPFKGAYDIVRILGAIAIAGGLPYTAAVKGHVSIIYFFQKLDGWTGYLTKFLSRLISTSLFCIIAIQCIVYGNSLKKGNVSSLTLRIPLFWIPYLIAFSCLLTALVILHRVFNSNEELMKS